jgi:hypothetical protein
VCDGVRNVELGTLTLRSSFAASRFVDESLMFQHGRACQDTKVGCQGSDPRDKLPGTTLKSTGTDTANVFCVSDALGTATCPSERPAVENTSCTDTEPERNENSYLCPITTRIIDRQNREEKSEEGGQSECSAVSEFFSLLASRALDAVSTVARTVLGRECPRPV